MNRKPRSIVTGRACVLPAGVATLLATAFVAQGQIVQPTSFTPIVSDGAGSYEVGIPGLDYQENHYNSGVIFNDNALNNYTVHTTGVPAPIQTFTTDPGSPEPFFDHGTGGQVGNNRAFLDGAGEHFTVRVNGFVVITTPGDYTIHLGADDTNYFVMDTLDGLVTTNHNCCPGNHTVVFTITQTGTFPFDNVFGEQAGGDWGDLSISGPGIVRVALGDTANGSPEVFTIIPDQTDSDGDGIPDGYETSNGLNPADPADAALDADGDSVSNLREFQFRTNLNNPDTDGDGFNDNVELNAGTNPRIANDFPGVELEVIELVSPTELRINVRNIPAGQTFHLRESSSLEGLVPLDPVFEFDADTVFPTTIAVNPGANSAEFFKIWEGPSTPVVTLPYLEDFEAGDGGFTATTFNPLNAAGALGPWVVRASQRGGGQVWSADGAAVNAPFEHWLTSPLLMVPGDGAVTLDFDHFHNFEANWDGGVIMMSVNGGPFVQVTDFTVNGYNDTVQTGDDWGYPDDMNGLAMFSNVSFGFIHSTANLGTLKTGDILQIRFRAGWDWGALNGSPNWEIENIDVKQTP